MEKILVVDHEKCTGCRLCEMVVIKWPLEGFELPMLCQQCEEAPCVAVCPKGALSRDAVLGRVALDYDLCIGCKMCVVACPFGGMGIDVVARQVIKCDLCDGDPTCVRFCDPGALQFVPASSVSLMKKRGAGLKLSEVMKRAFASRP
jgi:carbon-monoxide dehydrogenase iron sulfur subunit